MAGNVDQIGMQRIWWGLSVGVAIYGILVSIAFWFLEIRNEELVNCGRNALEILEGALTINGPNGLINLRIRNCDKNRIYLNDSLDMVSRHIPEYWLKILTKHRFWWRFIMLVSAILFSLAAIVSFWQFEYN